MEICDTLRVDIHAVSYNILAAQQVLRKYPHTAAHLQHHSGVIGRSTRKRVANLLRYIEVGQEVLTECLFCSYLLHRGKDRAKS